MCVCVCVCVYIYIYNYTYMSIPGRDTYSKIRFIFVCKHER